MLSWRNFPTDEQGFFHNPVLVSGVRDAILIDGVFRYSEARRIVEAITASGKRLTTVYVGCNDPDFYFGLQPILDAFPDARLIAAPVTIDAIAANVDQKLAEWEDRIGDDGPKHRADLALPVSDSADFLMLEGEQLEIVTHKKLFDRRTTWVPLLKALFGGTMIVSGVHVWIADTPRHETIAAWIDALDDLLALNPTIVVPGHFAEGGPTGVEAIHFTRDYLLAFEAARASASNSAALIAAMLSRYPNLGGAMWLELGAKVAMGEMAWG